MKTLSRIAVGLLATLGAAMPALAADLDKVSFGTNWLAEAEHGGFYQAVADGTYKKYGLDVTIVQGGPQAANGQLLIAGKIDFYMGGTLGAFDYVKQDIPVVDVAAIFQKDPQMFMTHPDAPQRGRLIARPRWRRRGRRGWPSACSCPLQQSPCHPWAATTSRA